MLRCALRSDSPSGIGVLASYAYDSLGRRSQIAYGNGTARLYEYDPAGRAKGVKIDLAGSADDLTIGQVAGAGTPLGYNAAGQLVGLTRSNDAYAWTAHAPFERDYATNGLNQYNSAGGVAFGYDGRGNLTSSGSAAYAYTRLNALKSAPNVAIGGTVTLGYDPEGRLSQYTTAGGTIGLLYAGSSLVGEIGTGGTMLRRYVHGPGSDEPIVWYQGAGTTDRRWLQADQRGRGVERRRRQARDQRL